MGPNRRNRNAVKKPKCKKRIAKAEEEATLKQSSRSSETELVIQYMDVVCIGTHHCFLSPQPGTELLLHTVKSQINNYYQKLQDKPHTMRAILYECVIKSLETTARTRFIMVDQTGKNWVIMSRVQAHDVVRSMFLANGTVREGSLSLSADNSSVGVASRLTQYGVTPSTIIVEDNKQNNRVNEIIQTIDASGCHYPTSPVPDILFCPASIATVNESIASAISKREEQVGTSDLTSLDSISVASPLSSIDFCSDDETRNFPEEPYIPQQEEHETSKPSTSTDSSSRSTNLRFNLLNSNKKVSSVVLLNDSITSYAEPTTAKLQQQTLLLETSVDTFVDSMAVPMSDGAAATTTTFNGSNDSSLTTTRGRDSDYGSKTALSYSIDEFVMHDNLNHQGDATIQDYRSNFRCKGSDSYGSIDVESSLETAIMIGNCQRSGKVCEINEEGCRQEGADDHEEGTANILLGSSFESDDYSFLLDFLPQDDEMTFDFDWE